MSPYETEVSTESPPWWDQEIRSARCGDLCLYQTTPWALRLNELLGYEPRYLVVSDKAVPKAMIVIFVAGAVRGEGFRGGLRHWAGKLGLLPNRFLIWHGQPAVSATLSVCEEREALESLARGLNALSKTLRLGISSGKWPLDHAAALPPAWSTRRWGTFRVDLRPGADILFEKFKQSARKGIKRAIRDNIVVRKIGTLNELREYYVFVEECSKRYGKQVYGFDDFATMWNYLRTSSIFETFVAEHDHKMIAGLSIWGSNGSFCEIGSFQSQDAYERKLFGPDLLKWRIMQWACEQGHLSFDLGGVNPKPVIEKEVNIHRFKEKWGGEYSEHLIVSA
jgi:hypothetical protein